ncbi:GNAT family N-acetyltransferase [Streptacidiphilus sp. N1-3]|uniref:GNAT family N-acetyltransferase n=1 Tax=Streptacidiphilus alkalitolerans TaxID=3342712 RepID=A0ABV6WUK6_9ACTN
MDGRSGLELANDNAATHWLAMAGVLGWESRTADGYTAVRCEGDPGDSHRVVITRRPADAAALTRELLSLFRDWETGSLSLEDPYGVLDLSGHGCESALAMPVMVRPPDGPVGGPVGGPAGRPPDGPPRAPADGPSRGPARGLVDGSAENLVGGPSAAPPVAPVRSPAVSVEQALVEEDLALLERVVVQGFPMPGRMPLRRGRLFPAALDALDGRRAWLARRGGEAAGACVSWDDGTAVGLYWVAVLEPHRSHGVARALLEAALRAHPQRAATLTATLLGEPLYRKLGFVEQAVSTWWRYPATVTRS